MESPEAHNIRIIEGQRELLAISRQQLIVLVAENKPPVVQELILAQRAVEDARMRLGVALGFLKGDDPFPVPIAE